MQRDLKASIGAPRKGGDGGTADSAAFRRMEAELNSNQKKLEAAYESLVLPGSQPSPEAARHRSALLSAYAMPGTDIASVVIRLRASYARSGTGIAHAAGCVRDMPYCSAIFLRVWYCAPISLRAAQY
eukprot:2514038-Rhodomonas_salina.2